MSGILYYEKNIVDIKHEYTEYLVNILVPLFYESFIKLAEKSIEIDKQYTKTQTPQTQNPRIIKIFQVLNKNIDSLSKHNIELETNKFRERSGCADWFDDLIKAVVKSYIILLTYNASGKRCKLIEEKFHERIDVPDFIHKCYIECSKIFINMPELLFNTDRRSKINAYTIINNSILSAIRSIIPIKLILKEYLKNDYIQEEHAVNYDELREKIRKELQQKYNEPEIQKPLIDVVSDDIKEPEQPVVVNKPIAVGGNEPEKKMTDHSIQNMFRNRKLNNIVVEKVKEPEIIKKPDPINEQEKKGENDEVEINIVDEDKEISDDEFLEKIGN